MQPKPRARVARKQFLRMYDNFVGEKNYGIKAH